MCYYSCNVSAIHFHVMNSPPFIHYSGDVTVIVASSCKLNIPESYVGLCS